MVSRRKKPQLLGDDGWCEETLILKPNTEPHLQVVLSWRHDPTPAPIDLGHVQVPAYEDPREQYTLERMMLRWIKRYEEARRQNMVMSQILLRRL
jgi:hypothetical protein